MLIAADVGFVNGGLAEEKRVGNCDGIDNGFGSKIIIVCFLLSLLKRVMKSCCTSVCGGAMWPPENLERGDVINMLWLVLVGPIS